ncbi:PfkB family carbohydrate kinase [Actibacterium sp. MT2.3-13A]|uniref:PfkB family carbohydrate kinase n=1 Tax=Actibacterium sp. MT2.3-13A TaxID=2828332 RepID=UPI001BA51165|nr:PfkB family carbohydrate kinase [Actibacterium sp. MT2.3-13A]
MTTRPDILCIGSVLWDVIGRSPAAMPPGADMPGHIRRLPGGVAMNIAVALRRHGLAPALLSVVGEDAEGRELLAEARAMGLNTDHVHRSADLPTDRYIAVEDARGLVAAIADARSLEAAGNAILAALSDGRLGAPHAPYPGLIALDGNLTETLLAEIAHSPLFAAADLRVAPASPGKAERLRPLLGHPRASFYVNLEEAGLLCGTRFADSAAAAAGLHAAGAARALVTAGAGPVTDATPGGPITRRPPKVTLRRVTGAGDSFMAAHIAAECAGADRAAALEAALAAAARHVSGD